MQLSDAKNLTGLLTRLEKLEAQSASLDAAIAGAWKVASIAAKSDDTPSASKVNVDVNPDMVARFLAIAKRMTDDEIATVQGLISAI